ncbi:NADP-binding protein [Gigaspora margarita]|uniref:Short-chain dehydrogenase/reductase 3 n=2 Tax=Gigaspora margarita TaxID=4874 RepID=A0A8H4EVI0_GIGMA|nr:NADP-binding protein [Gigaspora margarita]
MIFSIDFFIRILNVSLFHPSFAILFLVIIYVQGYGISQPEFLFASVYSFIVCFFWLLSYLSIKSRNGWKTCRLDWDDEVVVITGGSSGLGSLLAETLARNVTVIVLDIKPPEVEHDNIIYFECDVSKFEDVQRVAKEIIDEAGHPTILINNAGIVQGKTILESSEKEILNTLNINLLASFWTTKVFLPEMIKKNHGHIVTIASALGFIGMPQLADYCASKAALIGFHETLRRELDNQYNAKNVHTTLVCPGKMKTGMFDGSTVRFPFLTPSMATLEVVKPIITALDKNQGQDIFIPFYVNILALLRFLPPFVQDLLYKMNDGDHSMSKWKGKYNKNKDQ